MTIYLEIDGKPVDARKVVWCQYAPCGCICGASWTNSYAKDDTELVLTPQQAGTAMTETPKFIADRYLEDGFEWKPVADEVPQEFRNDCPHSPRFGRAVITLPAGNVWATTDRWFQGRKTHLKHIVPSGDLNEVGWRDDALCGKKLGRSSSSWTTSSPSLTDTVPCRRCEKVVSA